MAKAKKGKKQKSEVKTVVKFAEYPEPLKELGRKTAEAEEKKFLKSINVDEIVLK